MKAHGKGNAEYSNLSIILPAYNEVDSIVRVVKRLAEGFPQAEILVVDDCSSDNTGDKAKQAGARVVRHQYNMGNGAAIKTGARNAHGEILVFMDADGQHDDREINLLLERIENGFDLVVGARDSGSQATKGRLLGNHLLNHFASLMTGRNILDLTSGFRAARADVFKQFLYLLPNGFSYPTTTTMAFLRSGYAVEYVSIRARNRVGKSKVNFIRDGVRFLVIVMKIATLFSPMRFFFPASMLFFFIGIVRYVFFYIKTSAFSNMAGIMFITAMLIFLIGLISEQITALHYGISYTHSEEEQDSE